MQRKARREPELRRYNQVAVTVRNRFGRAKHPSFQCGREPSHINKSCVPSFPLVPLPEIPIVKSCRTLTLQSLYPPRGKHATVSPIASGQQCNRGPLNRQDRTARRCACRTRWLRMWASHRANLNICSTCESLDLTQQPGASDRVSLESGTSQRWRLTLKWILGSEVAHRVSLTLATVRRSNRACRSPAHGFHEDANFRGAKGGIDATGSTGRAGRRAT
jgi:hypothetical protein